jgi:hypothetical protein
LAFAEIMELLRKDGDGLKVFYGKDLESDIMFVFGPRQCFHVPSMYRLLGAVFKSLPVCLNVAFATNPIDG